MGLARRATTATHWNVPYAQVSPDERAPPISSEGVLSRLPNAPSLDATLSVFVRGMGWIDIKPKRTG